MAPHGCRRSASGFEIAATPNLVARIRTIQRERHLVVFVSGRLTSADMGRLEHACSPALTGSAQLLIDVRRVTAVDPSATAILEQLARRGVIVSGLSGFTPEFAAGEP